MDSTESSFIMQIVIFVVGEATWTCRAFAEEGDFWFHVELRH